MTTWSCMKRSPKVWPVLPRVVILWVFLQDFSGELQFLWWISQPFHNHFTMVPGRKEIISVEIICIYIRSAFFIINIVIWGSKSMDFMCYSYLCKYVPTSTLLQSNELSHRCIFKHTSYMYQSNSSPGARKTCTRESKSFNSRDFYFLKD